jgi:hypothetical protein
MRISQELHETIGQARADLIALDYSDNDQLALLCMQALRGGNLMCALESMDILYDMSRERFSDNPIAQQIMIAAATCAKASINLINSHFKRELKEIVKTIATTDELYAQLQHALTCIEQEEPGKATAVSDLRALGRDKSQPNTATLHRVRKLFEDFDELCENELLQDESAGIPGERVDEPPHADPLYNEKPGATIVPETAPTLPRNDVAEAINKLRDICNGATPEEQKGVFYKYLQQKLSSLDGKKGQEQVEILADIRDRALASDETLGLAGRVLAVLQILFAKCAAAVYGLLPIKSETSLKNQRVSIEKKEFALGVKESDVKMANKVRELPSIKIQDAEAQQKGGWQVPSPVIP